MTDTIQTGSFAPAAQAEPDYWIWTNSGKQFSYNYTHPDQICIEDIASALSKICRYSGHINTFYPVSDHCCNLVEYEEYYKGLSANPHYLLGVLLHDAAEAYLSDIPAPAKKLLPDFKRMEKKIYGVIAEKYGLPNDQSFHDALDYVDKNIVRDEAEKLFDCTPTWTKNYVFLGANIVVSRDHKQAKKRFLELYDELTERIRNYDSR